MKRTPASFLPAGIILLTTTFSHAAITSGGFLPVGDGTEKGPLALDAITSEPYGVAWVYGSSQPDLFAATGTAGHNPGVFLLPWIETDADTGAPVFGQPVRVQHPMATEIPDYGRVWQAPDTTIYGFFRSGTTMVVSTFDLPNMRFVQTASHSMAGQVPRTPSNIEIMPNDDGSYEVILGIGDGKTSTPQDFDRWDIRYRFYGGDGLTRYPLNFHFLHGLRLSSLAPGGIWSSSRLLSSTEREVLYLYARLTTVNLGPGHERDLITGSRTGNLLYYRNTQQQNGATFEPHRLVGSIDGVALRHQNIRPNPSAYPNPDTALSDLIVGGEGGLLYYTFTGNFDGHGAPIYAGPVPVLQQNADLYTGSLGVANIVDWDGNGVNDLVVGNSEGMVLFFRNRRTNSLPEFLPGVPIEADGEVIQVESGYWRSVQGAHESRWGYVCPEVADWNGDGLLDIVMGSTWGEYLVYLNEGTATVPHLAEPFKLLHRGMPLSGTWRSKPAVAQLGDRRAIVILDAQNDFHLYWQIDHQSVEDGGKLKLDDGRYISAGPRERRSGAMGRVKINLFDWDEDGRLDLLVGTFGRTSIPSPYAGLPADIRFRSSVLFLRNVGTDIAPILESPRFVAHDNQAIAIGGHSIGPDAGKLAPLNRTALVVAGESGRLLYYSTSRLSLIQWSSPTGLSHYGAGDD